VQSKSGNLITVSINSLSMAGTFVSGTATDLDRNTIFGAFDFLISFIRNTAIRNGGLATIPIVLATCYSAFTENLDHNGQRSTGQSLLRYAAARGLPIYDQETDFKVTAFDNRMINPDGVHPTTAETRRMVASHWARWMSGGATPPADPKRFLTRAVYGQVPADGMPFVYSVMDDGFVPSTWGMSPITTNLINELWANTLSSPVVYTLAGATVPVIDSTTYSPTKTLRCRAASVGALSTATRTTTSTSDGYVLEFDLYLPVVTGLSTSGTKTVNIAELRTTGGYLVVQLIITPTTASLRVATYTTPGAGLAFSPIVGGLAANTKHTIRLEGVRDANPTNGRGRYNFSLDGNRLLRSRPFLDAGQGLVATTVVGIIANTADVPLDVHFGWTKVQHRAARSAVSGTANNTNTLTITNGLITNIA
jgi:hypothetical protein